MQFTTTLGDFQKALAKTLPAIPRKSTIPILEHLSFSLTGNSLDIVATDQEITVKTTLRVDGIEDGKVLVPAKIINDITKALKNIDSFEFVSKDVDFSITLKTASAKYTMKGIDPDEYLNIPELFQSEKPEYTNVDSNIDFLSPTDSVIYFKNDDIVQLANRTSFAVSHDEYRPAMNGVLIHYKDNNLYGVATDSFRLSRYKSNPIKVQNIDEMNVILPLRAIELLKRFDEDVVMSFIRSKNKITHIRFDVGDTVALTRIIDEKFPPYETVIPIQPEKSVTFMLKEMLDSLRRVAIFSNTQSNHIKLLLENERMTILANDEDLGKEGQEIISCKYNGEQATIGFNHKYLIEMIQNLDNDDDEYELMIAFNQTNRPVILKPNTDDDTIIMILMPVRS